MSTTRLRQVLLTSVVVVVVGGVTAVGSYAAFRASTTNGGDAFVAGTVGLADNDAGAAVVTLSAAKPGDSATRCILVTYSGTLSSGVRIYGTPAGALATYLTLTITRGTDAAPAFAGCGSFTADATNYVGGGPGVVWTGPLSSFPTSYATGVVDPGAVWNTGNAHSYRISVVVANNSAAQAQTGTATFSWEARNL